MLLFKEFRDVCSPQTDHGRAVISPHGILSAEVQQPFIQCRATVLQYTIGLQLRLSGGAPPAFPVIWMQWNSTNISHLIMAMFWLTTILRLMSTRVQVHCLCSKWTSQIKVYEKILHYTLNAFLIFCASSLFPRTFFSLSFYCSMCLYFSQRGMLNCWIHYKIT